MTLRVGVNGFTTDRSPNVGVLAREVEARGFTEFWVPEHSHIPVGRETRWPLADANLPEEYRRTLDPFVALTVAASSTTHLTLGTGVCLVAQHDPLLLAKTIATLDHVCGGRLVVGVGFGWNVDEMRHHGVEPASRRSVGREKSLAMRELWTNDIAEYHGDHVDFSATWQWPKPRQHPHPPLWVGGGKASLRHVVEWGDGWMPLEGAMPIVELVRHLRQTCEAADRDPDEIAIYVSSHTQDAATLESYRAVGIDGVSLWVDWDRSLDEIKRLLDDHAAYRDAHALAS